MNVFQAAAASQQFASKPVEQFWMAGLVTCEAEIAGAAYKPFTEVMHPQAIHDHSSRQ